MLWLQIIYMIVCINMSDIHLHDLNKARLSELLFWDILRYILWDTSGDNNLKNKLLNKRPVV